MIPCSNRSPTARFPDDPSSLADGISGEWLLPPAVPLSGRIVDDSRRVAEGDVFVAVKGESTDGFNYIRQSADAGAGIIIVDRRPGQVTEDELRETGTGLILVDDGLKAFHALAAAHRRRFRKVPLIAVTGSSGKTSIRCMIQSILERAFPGEVLATQGNTNNHFGVPRNVFRLDENHRAAVLELGTNHPGEIADLAAIVQPDVAVVGNIGKAHIEFFGTQDGIAREKGSLFSALPRGGVAVMPVTGPGTEVLQSLAGKRKVLTFGTRGSGAGVEYRYLGSQNGHYRLELKILNGSRRRVIDWHLPGEHQAGNAGAATAACSALGVENRTILEGLSHATLPAMRTGIAEHDGVMWYNDAYNANPESARASLNWFAETRSQPGGTDYLVLGDMLELGPGHCRGEHISLLETAIRMFTDGRIIGVGPAMSRAGSGLGVLNFATAEEAAAWLRERLREGDRVLLKGSRGIRLERVMEMCNRSR